MVERENKPMAGGWSRDGAVEEQIAASVSEAIERARKGMPEGGDAKDSARKCVECGEPIPEARRRVLPGVKLCVACAGALDSSADHSAYNRRGSKNSQLK